MDLDFTTYGAFKVEGGLFKVEQCACRALLCQVLLKAARS